MTRWAVNADIFLLSPQRTPTTWQRHQISKNRLLLSLLLSKPLMFNRVWAKTNIYHYPSFQIFVFINYQTAVDISQNLSSRSWELLRCAVPAGLVAGLQLGLAWEAGTKHLHKKSSWAPQYYLCIPPESESVSWQISRESEILSWENTSRRAPPT